MQLKNNLLIKNKKMNLFFSNFNFININYL